MKTLYLSDATPLSIAAADLRPKDGSIAQLMALRDCLNQFPGQEVLQIETGRSIWSFEPYAVLTRRPIAESERAALDKIRLDKLHRFFPGSYGVRAVGQLDADVRPIALTTVIQAVVCEHFPRVKLLESSEHRISYGSEMMDLLRQEDANTALRHVAMSLGGKARATLDRYASGLEQNKSAFRSKPEVRGEVLGLCSLLELSKHDQAARRLGQALDRLMVELERASENSISIHSATRALSISVSSSLDVLKAKICCGNDAPYHPDLPEDSPVFEMG